MVFLLKTEIGKDASGEEKRIMWCTLDTENEGMGVFTTVAELPDDDILSEIIDDISSQMLKAKQKEIKAKNKKKVESKKKK